MNTKDDAALDRLIKAPYPLTGSERGRLRALLAKSTKPKQGERGFQPGCGCCVGPEDDRCVCHIHQDVRIGRPPRKCSLHK